MFLENCWASFPLSFKNLELNANPSHRKCFLTDFIKNYLFGKLSINSHLIFAKFSLMKYDTLFILLILFYIVNLDLDLTLLIRLKSCLPVLRVA